MKRGVRLAALVLVAFMGHAHADADNDWQAAVSASYVESNLEDKGDGVSEFTACFRGASSKCEAFAFGARDEFRKLRIFTPGIYSNSPIQTYLQNYVSIVDGKPPSLMLSPYFFGKNGWLFMRKLAILADGKVVLERDIPQTYVKRENNSYGVEEQYTFIADDADITALRKVANSKSFSVRITGEKGYTTLKKDNLKYLKTEIANSLYIFDALSAAIKTEESRYEWAVIQ